MEVDGREAGTLADIGNVPGGAGICHTVLVVNRPTQRPVYFRELKVAFLQCCGSRR